MSKVELTASDLRTMIGDAIAPTIELRRASVAEMKERYRNPAPSKEPSDEEIDDFIFSNPMFDEELVEQLVDPGFLGFSAKRATVTSSWLKEFKSDVEVWATNQTWLGGDDPWRRLIPPIEPTSTELWKPSDPQPPWLTVAPGCLLIAADLLRHGQLLSELSWRQFETLIAELLESEGWTVSLTRPCRDGGIDVIATFNDKVVGEIRSLWQAKKYGPHRKVRLRDVRELSGILTTESATKAVMVTTSHLTRDAIEWVRHDVYRMAYRDREFLEKWIRGVVLDR